MNRPKVNIKRDNTVNYLLEQLNNALPNLITLKGIIGVTLNGGLSRGYGDHLSEIDITIFLDDANYQLWDSGYCPITTFITKIDENLYDIKYVKYSDELKKEYSIETELWDLSYSKILYDPNGLIEEFFNNKLAKKCTQNDAEQYMFEAWWYYKLATDIWIYRKDVLQGHMMLNSAVSAIIKAVFTCNEEYIPHEKWLIHMSRTLEWKPKHWNQKLIEAFRTGKMNIDNLKVRQNALDGLWNEINDYLSKEFHLKKGLSIIQKSTYDLLRSLCVKSKIPITEWQKKASLKMLNCDPFAKVVKVIDGYIEFDYEACSKISEKNMYYLYYQILDTVRK
ncbi:MAG: DUF4037 domain-containing protein [Lentisphaerae bacterium]|nr:DUF4037 domain-containing protein [Lentisphaerota bacterium]MCP4103212.1 DUF4037 domain-containing protein [Lentisphaerota bacterium]